MRKTVFLLFMAGLMVLPGCSRLKDDLYTITTSSPDVKSFSHKFTFHKSNLVDGNVQTSWQVRNPKGGVGEWIELSFKKHVNVKALEIANGFQLVDGEYGDLYYLNSRLRKVRVCANKTLCKDHVIDDTKIPFIIPIDQKDVSKITIYIKEIYTGSRWPQDLAIGEIRVIGAADYAMSIAAALVIALLAAGVFVLYKRGFFDQIAGGGTVEEKIAKIKKAPTGSFNQESYDKGKDFEHFVAKLFGKNKGLFTIEQWTYDIHNKHREVFVEADQNPDFIIRHNPSGARFAVECKFRSHTVNVNDGAEQAVHWATPEQIKHYNEFSKKNNLPVIVMIGLGGKPKYPLVSFIIPLNEAQYPELYMGKLRKSVRLPVNRGFEWKEGLLV